MSSSKNTAKIITDSASTPNRKDKDQISLKKDSAGQKKKDSVDPEAERLRARIEDFKLWTDDKAFQEQEYERRRNDKKRRKGILKNDKHLQRWRKCYIPAVIAVGVGTLLLLCSSLDGLSEESIFSENRKLFQIFGGIVLGFGFIMIMITAAYTYHREDVVRHNHGFPTLFEASKLGHVSSTLLDETLFLQQEFVDKNKKSNLNSSCNGRISRMTSYESSNSFGNLGASFSSTSTAMTWIYKHATRFQQTAAPLRRQNSDTCLHQNFARTRFISWNQNTEIEIELLSEGQDTNKDCRSTDGHTSPSQTSSTTSRTSSGYHSSISCPGTDTVSRGLTVLDRSRIKEEVTKLPLSKTSENFVFYDTAQVDLALTSFTKSDIEEADIGDKRQLARNLNLSKKSEEIVLLKTRTTEIAQNSFNKLDTNHVQIVSEV